MPLRPVTPHPPRRRPFRRFSLVPGVLVALAVGALTAGVLTAVSATAATTHNPIGHLDSLAYANGSVSMRGWAWDGDSAAAVRVALQVDNRSVLTISANQSRVDVGQAYPAAGSLRGFSATSTVANGSHTLCVIAVNTGAGANTNLGCRTWTFANDPIGNLDTLTMVPGGIRLSGWALDPNSAAPIRTSVVVDGATVSTVTASVSRSDVGVAYPFYGPLHGYVVTVAIAPGSHTVCVRGINVGQGNASSQLRCLPYLSNRSPFGSMGAITRTGTGNSHVTAPMWAIDPDTASPISVTATVDGVIKYTAVASGYSSGVLAAWPVYGASHYRVLDFPMDTGEHRVCLNALNVGAGADSTIGCSTLLSTGDSTPAPVSALTAGIGSTVVDLSWTASRSVQTPVTGYTVTVNPGNRVIAAGTATTAHITGLTNNVQYTFTVRAANALGVGSATSVTGIPVAIPPQTTPAPVSTSHYVRNLTGNAATDSALMRAMGATDAGNNPSGHRYLVLLQIGGQDLAGGGVLLSATSRFVSNAGVVTAMNAYLDGYASRQKGSAPLTLAIGTNNDVDVSAGAGAIWARNVVNPVGAYARKYPSIAIAGANDIEPGFSATVAESQAWLSGYLGATSASFVFNGSADGCSTTRTASACNNGWSMAALQWLSGGASPSRISSLPQIYNTAMPLQWKNISLTGAQTGKARVNFSGPLTEWTACAQAGSCGSLSNVVAWQQLWAAISSSTATRQAAMPHGTDLRIN